MHLLVLFIDQMLADLRTAQACSYIRLTERAHKESALLPASVANR
jgi:hypothetical protein